MYFIIIGIAMLAISVFNILFNAPLFDGNVLYIIGAVVFSTIAVILVDSIFATFIRRCLPKKWFEADVKLFIVSKKEQRFYEKLGIKKWKDKVLELGVFTGFRKNKIYDPNSVEYVERFLLESNFGYIIHMVCCLVGFLIVFLYPLKYALFIGVPVAIVNLLLNLMAACVLRYNTPKLQTLRKYARRKENQAKQDVESEEDEALVAQG